MSSKHTGSVARSAAVRLVCRSVACRFVEGEKTTGRGTGTDTGWWLNWLSLVRAVLPANPLIVGGPVSRPRAGGASSRAPAGESLWACEFMPKRRRGTYGAGPRVAS